MKTIEELNAIAVEYLKQLPELVEAVLIDDHDFFLSGLDGYKLIAVPEAELESYDVPELCTIIPQEAFEQIIRDPYDILPHYFHVMGHNKCLLYWRRITFPRQLFTENELSYFEEIYNTHLFRRVAPSVVQPFIRYCKVIDGYRKFADPVRRRILNSAFEDVMDYRLPERIKKIVEPLFKVEVLDHITFQLFMRVAYGALEDGFRIDLAEYDKIAT
ncbi:hypothetical protein [Ralstonia phage RP31]|uniref:Uncharacterized protein n=2 Tax=Ripduovirus RP12 TaxID=2560700 RepID=A0A1L7N0R9_9CAUD|nr:hypothetical protein FDH28_gp081 [Ralstonia phage RP12]BAW19055.1 hypothetical protein [Ralstonia phage RP12]BAW19340.1 hypothetical protein [Ralstonia phage RP31]